MLIPREHGAYGQLLFPLVAALAVGRWSPGALLLAVAVTAAFLAHESLLVVLGQRGSRALREQGGDGWRSLATLGAACLASGTGALWLMPRQAVPYLVVPVVLGALVMLAVFMHRERTTGGEMLVGTALSSASLPVAVASGLSVGDGVSVVVVFACVFATATVAVRAVIGRVSKAGGPSTRIAAVCAVGAVAALSALASARVLTVAAPWAALPVCLVALGLSTRPPSPRHLRVVGWTLVGLTALSALILVVGLRYARG